MSKATLYLDDDLHRALRLKAAETRESMSELVNEALRVLLAEDLEDISDWQQRRSERAMTYEEFLKQLAADGDDMRSTSCRRCARTSAASRARPSAASWRQSTSLPSIRGRLGARS